MLTQQIRQLDGVREALDGVITANQKGLKALAGQIDQVQKLAGDGGALEELTKATKGVKDALEGHSKKILDLGSEREKLSELFEKNRKDIAAISALSGPEGELSKSVKALECGPTSSGS